LATEEEITTLEGQLATWIDANGQPPDYPSDTLFITTEEGRQPLLQEDFGPVVEFSLDGEALERFKEHEPDISARLQIGSELALTHTVPHHIYVGGVIPDTLAEVGNNYMDAESKVECYVATSPDSPLESIDFELGASGHSSKTYMPRDDLSVMVGPNTASLAGQVTFSDYTNVVGLLAALERSHPL
jgi:hypothetical protein